MTDKFTCCPIDRLLKWILAEEKTGQIFGIVRELFFAPDNNDPFKISRYGQVLDTPVGVAAGPHTQLSQNIISAWLTGARYIELKTVQTLDELDVTKPCIDMTDEGYNCEWSQELKLDQSFSEYLNAWILIHVLKDRLGWGDADVPGFIFNMSVGYNMEGILSSNVQRFLDRMSDCREEKAARVETLAKIYPRVKDLVIPDTISNNLTISTMHGCPPEEIEKIGRYFIQERKIHTTIKLNPTLLGPERLREILNKQLGYSIEVPDEAFDHDLKYEDGLALISALKADAQETGVTFNLKLTNTLETVNHDQNLPKNEGMVYMSGRALHPISVALADKLQGAFEGTLDISFSAGVDCFNIAQLLSCNIKPLTVCSDLLKPGGYGRLSQYLELLRTDFGTYGIRSIDDYILSRAKGETDLTKAGLSNLKDYAQRVVSDHRYQREAFPYESIKTGRELTPFDCVKAPCVVTCPASQNVPHYMAHTASGDFEGAWQSILETNPFPRVQGLVCDQNCQSKCTRMNYDRSLQIRGIKRFAAEKHQGLSSLVPAADNGLSVAVIGAGPSGLTCAHFLALSGFRVDVYELKTFPGGMAADGIPLFRLDEESLKQDIDGILSLGVQVHYNEEIDSIKFEQLRESHDYMYLAVGARKGLSLGIPGEEAAGVMDQLSFLSAVRRGDPPKLGKKVVIIGGGNSAIDSARTARRLVDTDGEVSILYRRTRREMPAEQEEIEAALQEGIHLIELTAPECLLTEDGKVTANVCFRMELGAKDESGRRKPIKIEGSEFHIQANSVISAIGQEVITEFFPKGKIKVDPETLETGLTNVFAGGDAVRGASSLINAIGDGKRAAEVIREKASSGSGDIKVNAFEKTIDLNVDFNALQVRQARRIFFPESPEMDSGPGLGFELIKSTLDEGEALEEAGRCLQCDQMCNICVTVCPNRANIAYLSDMVEFIHQQVVIANGKPGIMDLGAVRISQPFQVINISDFCNECGNCSTFCPTSGAPYQSKPKFYLNKDSFISADKGYMLEHGVLHFKNSQVSETVFMENNRFIYETPYIRVQLNQTTFKVEEIDSYSRDGKPVDLVHGAQMGVMLSALKEFYLFI